MSDLGEFLPLPPNKSEIDLSGVRPEPVEPIFRLPQQVDTQSDDVSDFIQPSFETKMASQVFDYEKSGADRFKQSSQFGVKGFDPYAGYETIGGKPYDVNELKYAEGQTWGDVMSNAVGGSLALAKNTFVEGWKGWSNFGDALFTIGTDKSFMEALAGSPEELMQKDEEQKAIFNKYAIFKSPINETGFGVFNREFVGDMIQQAGFSIGAGAQFLSEMALTWGIGEGIGAVAKGAGWLAKGVETGAQVSNDIKAIEMGISASERAKQVASTGKIINEARQITDPTSLKSFSSNFMLPFISFKIHSHIE